jgi:hypothetical protein
MKAIFLGALRPQTPAGFIPALKEEDFSVNNAINVNYCK